MRKRKPEKTLIFDSQNICSVEFCHHSPISLDVKRGVIMFLLQEIFLQSLRATPSKSKSRKADINIFQRLLKLFFIKDIFNLNYIQIFMLLNVMILFQFSFKLGLISDNCYKRVDKEFFLCINQFSCFLYIGTF